MVCAALAVHSALAWGPTPGFPNSLGRTPFRGWRSWQAVGAEVTQTVMQTAMAGLAKKRPLGVGGGLVSLADYGYNDAGLDGGYFEKGAGLDGSCHDANGHMLVNTSSFPSLAGMVKHAHDLNLTASWYLNADGCPGDLERKAFPNGTYGSDASEAAALGFDGLKFDTERGGPSHNITAWAVAVNGTGRPMMIENCLDKHPKYLLTDPASCAFNFYRAGPDNAPSFLGAMSKVYHWLDDFLGVYVGGVAASRPGCFAYADMLSIGAPIAGTAIYNEARSNGCANMSLDEERTLFAAWSVVSSPLVIAFDVADDAVVARYWPIVTNERALAINAAWAGEAGRRLKEAPPSDPAALPTAPVGVGCRCEAHHNASFPAWVVYSKRQPGGAVAVLAIRLGAAEVAGSAALELSAAELAAAAALPMDAGANAGAGAGSGSFEATDVWSGATGPTVTAVSPWRPAVSAHNSTFVVFRPV
jgi:hypothetical protein